MQQARRQGVPLQRTGRSDRHGVEDPEDFQSSPLSPHIQWLQHTVEVYFVRPKTRKGQLFCWLFWLVFAATVGILFWQVLPRFVDHGKHSLYHADPLLKSCHCWFLIHVVANTVVKPTIKYIEVCLSPG